jgi:hypothetical protein
MAISSNTLFHFYNKFDYLIQSIEEGLWPRYCIEKKWNGKDLAIPMFSFCDIPLSQIKDHIDENKGYGSYGIGVTKDFARENKITPVIYLYKGSLLINKISYYMSRFDTPSINSKKMDLEEFMLYYVKKVSGYNQNTELKRKFYNEREWRFIPQITHNVHLEVLTGDYNKDDIINKYSIRTEKEKIKLKPKDIVYIIVKNECEIKDLIKVLKKTYDNDSYVEVLLTKILTVKQIMEDF